MTVRGSAHGSGGAISRLSPPVRMALAAGLLALGIGDVAAINLVLLPRHFAGDPGTREPLGLRSRRMAAVAPPLPSPPVASVPVPEPVSEPVSEPSRAAAAPSVEPTPGVPIAVAPSVSAPVLAPVAAAPAPTLLPPPSLPPAELPPIAATPSSAPVAVVARAPSEAPASSVLAAPIPPAQPAPLPEAPRLAVVQTAPPAPSGPADGSLEAASEGFPDLLFARNALWLSPASRTTLNKLAETLTLDPERRVLLSGHADTVGDPEFNRWISLARARRAGRYLQDRGVEKTRIQVKSFGSARPVEGEPVSGVRARNRRVEIAVQ